MSAILPLALSSSAFSGVPRHPSNPARSDHVLVRNSACHILETRCGPPQERLTAAQIHILYEKAARRRLRAEITAFLRERGTIRSANSPVNAEDDVTLPGADESMDSSADIYDAAGARYLEESPLRMRSKRRDFLVLAADTPLKRRRFTLAP